MGNLKPRDYIAVLLLVLLGNITTRLFWHEESKVFHIQKALSFGGSAPKDSPCYDEYYRGKRDGYEIGYHEALRRKCSNE